MELFRALAALAEPPDRPGVGRLAAALGLNDLPAASEHTEVFVFQLAPYASIYLGAEGMLGGEARDRVAGFWRALGQTPPAEADHLTLMLALYARLSEFEAGEDEASRRAGWRRARKAFLWEHLSSWLPVYLDKLVEIAPPFYRRWAELLTSALAEEVATLGAQDELPLHLREAPALAVDTREHDGEDFLQTLLAPARSGMIVTRADLVRAARALGISLRAGERKFILKALLNQDAAGVLGWLAEEASSWSRRHQLRRASYGEVAAWWEKRAADASSVLRGLRAEVIE